jgi:hypothetical protein
MGGVSAATWMDTLTRTVPPFLAALLVLIGVLLTIRQKDRNDHKEQWWKRVQWAADAVASADERRQFVGMSALTALIGAAHRIDDGDESLLQAIVNHVDLSRFAAAASVTETS